jgi:hypothetical protein
VKRHLRDVETICPAVSTLLSGLVLNRCELDRGHDGQHKDGCTYWGKPLQGIPEVE